MLKCLAAICTEVGKPFTVDEITVDSPQEGEVLIKLAASGFCRTDLQAWNGQGKLASLPAVLGHEGAGTVCEVGAGVVSVSEGDSVIPLYMAECGQCALCRSPDTNLCLATMSTQPMGLMPNGTARMSWKGQPLYHFMGTSTFSEYIVVPEIAAAKVSSDVPLEEATLFGCAATTGVGAPLFGAHGVAGSTVAVFGCGTVGLNVVQGAVLAKAKTIIGVDFSEDRRKQATAYGATHVIDASDGRAVQRVRRLTGGGADFTFEAAGNIRAMEDAFEACRYGGGKCSVIGLAPAGETMSITPQMLISGRSLTGTAFGGAKGRTDVPKLVDWYRDGRIRLDGLVTKQIPLTDINLALDAMLVDQAARYQIIY